ncbi:MAG: hypothetical protein JSS66_12485 [Armatimonadetes bacterium]|nr:hypothetical protein [Armatimonadota bacterium]
MSFLLTDGTVLLHNPLTRDFYKLTPDINGSYVNGTFTQVASLPTGYGPLYYASAVLANGRVMVAGGEYNLNGNGVWTNKGAWYDPVANVWTNLNPPSGWGNIGDAQCSVMPDGTLLMAMPFDTRMARLNPSTMTWTNLTSQNKADRHDEEGWTLLPDGNLITVDALNAPGSEKYIVSQDRWISAGSTIVRLEDPGSQEIGPMVLMANGKCLAFGATGHNALYTPGVGTDPGTWQTLPDFPIISGQLDIADGPACLLPNGNVLCVASPGIFNPPSHFFEYDGSAFTQVAAVPNAPGNSSYVGNFLVLPNGQIMYTDFSNDVEIYTPTGGPQDAWRPTITTCPSSVGASQSFVISGTQFNGLSQGSYYGDDSTNATNYPIVRIKNNATGHVKYCRTHDHSTMAVATGSATVSTNVDVPASIELGPSTIEVVCNGIASAPRAITIGTQSVTVPTSYTIIRGALAGGNVASLANIDSDPLSVLTGPVVAPSEAPVKVSISATSPTLAPASFQVTMTANVITNGTTQNLSLYNFQTNAFEVVDTRAGTTNYQTVTVNGGGNLARFVNQSTGEVRCLVSYLATGPTSVARWKVNVDQLNWTIQ